MNRGPAPTPARTSAVWTLVIACPFILFLYPAAALFAGTSEFPSFFQKYSYGAAAFNLMTLALYACFVAGMVWRASLLVAVAVLALIVLTYAVPASNNILILPGTLPLLAAVRLAGSISLVGVALLGMRRGKSAASVVPLLAGALFFVPSAIDTGFLLSRNFTAPAATTSIGVGYRTTRDLSKLTDHDIVLVGDSFVWGQGVEIEQRFGDVLQAKLRQADPQANVYSLGIIGVGLKDYVKSVRDVPQGSRARRLIIAFYQNDMPPMDTFDGWMERLSLAIGRSSVSARLLLDMVRLSFAPNVDQYAKALLDNYKEDGIDFPARWQTLVAYFKSLYDLSAGRSVGKPILVIIPALAGSDREKWASAHRRVARAAADAGFEVLDLFSDFKVGTPETLRYRLAPNDLHFDVEGNKLVADRLVDLLKGRPPSNRAP
jgi:lysophospholipase L1-like esterase